MLERENRRLNYLDTNGELLSASVVHCGLTAAQRHSWNTSRSRTLPHVGP